MKIQFDKKLKRYYFKFKPPNGKRRSIWRDDFGNFFESAKEAADYEIILKARRLGTIIQPQMVRCGVNFKSLFYNWIERTGQRWRRSSRHNLIGKLEKNILKQFPNIDICDLVQDDFDLWRSKLEKFDASGKYKNCMLNYLISICKYANTFYSVNMPHAERLTRFRGNVKGTKKLLNRRYVPFDDINAFMSAIDQQRHPVLFHYWITDYFSGARPGESKAYSVEDFNYITGSLVCNKQILNGVGTGKAEEEELKTEASYRTHILPLFICKFLKNYIDRHHLSPKAKNYLFYSAEEGPTKPIGKRYIDYWKRFYCKKAGIPLFDNHSMRHSAATNARVLSGLNVVRDFLGHDSETTTSKTYDHSGKLGQKKLAEDFDKNYANLFDFSKKN